MTNKKWTGGILVALMMIFLGGCADGPKDENVLKVGVSDDYPPFEFRNENNETVGFEIDMAKALGEQLGMEVEFVSTAFDTIFVGLESGNYDVIISAVSITPSRLESMLFTKPHLSNGQVVVTRTGAATVNAMEELSGLKVGVQLGTTADVAAEKYQEDVDFELVKYDEIIQTFTAMKAGHVDVIVVDYAVAIDYASKEPQSYAISDVLLTNEPIGIALRKDSADLLDKLNDALDAIRADGTLKSLSMEWLGEDYTSEIDEELRVVE